MELKHKKNIEISYLKGSGPGGQNRNKRMSGVRARHIPTGITVLATERRSQKQNLEMALLRLEEKLKRYFYVPRVRKKSRPSQGSVEKRLEKKKKKGIAKKLRGKKTSQWE